MLTADGDLGHRAGDEIVVRADDNVGVFRLDRVVATTPGEHAQVTCLRRPGDRPTLVCLHGFGSTKEDYADLSLHPAFDGRDLVRLDAPGFGDSTIDDPATLSIELLADVAIGARDALGIDRLHLCGHSMGGLTGCSSVGPTPTGC